MTASHRVFDAILPHVESGRFPVGSGLREARLGGERAHPELRDRGIVALLSILVQSLPLQTAVVASSNDGAPRIVAWASASRPDASHETHHIPLTDRDGSFAGCLQLETDGVLREDDLAFARAVAGEMARVGGVPADVPSQRALLGSVDALDGATRLAVLLSTIASVCIIEKDDSQIVSVPEVSSFVDHERISGLVEHLVGASEGSSCANIERSCRALVESDRALVAKLGLHSIVHVPLASENGRARVILLGGDDDPPFHPTLLRCVAELASGGETDGNAHLYRTALAGVRYFARELTVVSHHRVALEGSFVTLIEPAAVADSRSAQLREVRRAAARLSHVL